MDRCTSQRSCASTRRRLVRRSRGATFCGARFARTARCATRRSRTSPLSRPRRWRRCARCWRERRSSSRTRGSSSCGLVPTATLLPSPPRPRRSAFQSCWALRAKSATSPSRSCYRVWSGPNPSSPRSRGGKTRPFTRTWTWKASRPTRPMRRWTGSMSARTRSSGRSHAGTSRSPTTRRGERISTSPRRGWRGGPVRSRPSATHATKREESPRSSTGS
jgi:hypothetical protein